DYSGRRVGRLTVDSRSGEHRLPSGRVYPKWRCVCDCGSVVEVLSVNLRDSATTKSCGCLHREMSAERMIRVSHLSPRQETKHGHSTVPSREYRSWTSLLSRCRNPRDPSYPYYGGRG